EPRLGRPHGPPRVGGEGRRAHHATVEGAPRVAAPQSVAPAEETRPMSKVLPMLDPFDEIKKLYFSTTRDTIERDLARALDLLTRMPSDADRDSVAGYMHGLADLRREWKGATPTAKAGKQAKTAAATPARPSERLPRKAASDPE